MKSVPFSRRADPTYPAGHPQFKWTSGADVQATWMRLTSWRPIYTNQPPKYEEPRKDAFVTILADRRRAV